MLDFTVINSVILHCLFGLDDGRAGLFYGQGDLLRRRAQGRGRDRKITKRGLAVGRHIETAPRAFKERCCFR
jgi:hypothetical protein